MNLTTITSATNTICKQTVSLQQRKYRREYGLFVLEGARSVLDAVTAGHRPEYVMVSDDFFDLKGSDELLSLLTATNAAGYQVPDKLMKKLAGTETPQGLLAVFPKPAHRLSQLLNNFAGFWLVLDRIQDPGNLGTLIRSAEAAGVDAVLITKGSADPYNPKALRAATGAVLHLPVVELKAEESDGRMFREEGIQLVGATLEGGSPYYAQRFQSPMALVIGNEAQGIRSDLLAQLDQRVTIPMKGRLQSLNAAIAGSILLFHLTKELGPSWESFSLET